MKATKSAARYAKALLELCIEKNKVDNVSSDLNAFLTAYQSTRDFQLFLDNPIIKAEKKIDIFKILFPDFCDLTSLFMQLIFKNRREGALAQIAHSFISQLKENQGIIPVTIVSASKLDDKTRQTLTSKLASALKGKLEIEEKINENLIGGFVLQMGDTQYDASISSKLRNLKVSLTK
ncbi:MAG: ATP synthase F1 subunit delta [Flavobacteriia bacterium]|nr:ATP synthase F1 subunit delta [Flavobacteriia bacterium]